MKTNLQGVVFGVSFLSLVACVGCAEDEIIEGVPVVANAASTVVLAPAETAPPANAPVPVVVNAPPAANAANNEPATAAATNKVSATNLVVGPVEVPALSPAMTELVRLLQAGVNPEVVTAFITNSTTPFYVGSAEILYLRDLGAPPAVLTTLIQHDASPEIVARKQAAVAVKPLPMGVALNTPATNIFPQKPAVQNPPEPMPVNPPPNGAAFAPPVPVDNVVYETPVESEPVSYSYFYSSLAPYGNWSDVPGYGYCWRPTVSVYNSSWRPYCDEGRWLWSDSGWYWYSGYSWGWAPFHYGRWCQPAGLGWCWQPDTCWGPSWVSWRYSAGYCGWAPLPPSACWTAGVGFYNGGLSVGIGFDFGLASSCYVFCPTTRFCDPKPYNHCVPNHQATGLYKDSTVVNNYVLGNNNTIINNGVGFDKVAKVTRGDIRKVTVRDMASAKDAGVRHESLSADGGTLTVHRPSASTLSARGNVASSGQRVAGITTPRTYGGSDAVGISKPSTGSTLASAAAGGSAWSSKSGVAAKGNSVSEPHSIRPIITRAPEAPILTGGSGSSSIVSKRSPGYAYNSPVGSSLEPNAGGSKPLTGPSSSVDPGSVRNTPTGVKPVSGSPVQVGNPRSVGRADPGGYAKPTVPTTSRAPTISQPSSPAYGKPSSGVSPARNYSAPVRSAPVHSAPSYSAPAVSRVGSSSSSAPRPSVSVSSVGGGSSSSRSVSVAPSSGGGGGASRSSSAPSSSSVGGKVGR